MVGAAIVAASVLGGNAQAKPRCGHICADDVRACVALAKVAHQCGRMQPGAAKQCRIDRKAARRSCHTLPAACNAGRKVCSGQ
jgi:hypothetical protein